MCNTLIISLALQISISLLLYFLLLHFSIFKSVSHGVTLIFEQQEGKECLLTLGMDSG